jgi:DNA polymerase-1
MEAVVDPNVLVLLVADNPSDEEAQLGAPDWSSDDWATVRTALENVLVPLDQVSISWATRCPAGKSHKKDIGKDEIENCRAFLYQEIGLFPNLQTVVCMGRIAAASVLSIPLTRVSSARGKITTLNIGGRELHAIITVHPYQALMSAFDMESFEHDLRQAYVIAQPGYKPFSMEEHKKIHMDTYTLVTDTIGLKEVIDEYLKEPMVSFDVETRGLDPWHMPDPLPKAAVEKMAFVTSLQLSCGPGQAIFIPICNKEFSIYGTHLEEAWFREIKRFFEFYEGILVAYNGKFDQVAIGHDFGIVPRLTLDPMIIDQLRRGMPARSLKKLAWEVSTYGGYESEMKTAGAAMGEQENDSYYYPLDTLFWYGCLDVDVTWRAAQVQLEILEKDTKLAFMSEYVAEASTALSRIEVDGWKIDQKYLESFGEMQREIISDAKEEIRLAAPEAISIYEKRVGPFSASSPKALGSVLFDLLDLPSVERTPKGEPSTARAALDAIKNAHPIVPYILDLRKAEKAYNAFYKRWKEGMAEDGKLHFRYNLIKFRDADTGETGGTETGRLSSSGAAGNVQQIPKEDIIRCVFLPDDENSVILDVDFSTLEYVVAAVYSKDTKLCAAFKKGYDIHAAVAAEMFGSTPEKMALPENKKLRARGKTMNFSSLYGAGAQNVAEQLNVSVPEAENFLATYKAKFPELFKWIDKTKRALKKSGFSESKFGRKRFLPDAKLPPAGGATKGRVEAALRQGINGPIQGDASDICLWGLVRLTKWLDDNGKKSKLKATIHDALVLSVPIDELEEVHAAVVDILTHPGIPWLDSSGVPLRVKVSVGSTWGSLNDVVEE